MKRALSNILLLLLLLVGGCTKNEFSIDIDLAADVDGTYTFVYYASDRAKGWIAEQVVSVNKGKAQFTCPTVLPSLVYVMSGSAATPQAVFYAERGDKIKISGKSANPAQWKITGNDISDALSAFRLEAVPAAGDPKKLNAAVAKRVAEHPEEGVSALLLLTMYDRRSDEKGFRAAWRKLKGEAAEARWTELTGRGDMVGNFDPSLNFPKTIVLSPGGNVRDTIETGNVPVLLYFSRPHDSYYKEDMTALKALTREYSDSARRIIADISFETDSMGRQSAIRRDSLSKAVHAWMPLGLSDSLAARMGVTRLPYVILLNAKGKEAYRGSDLKEAVKAFKLQMKKPSVSKNTTQTNS